nr:capsid protein [Sarcosphaera coronaria partitivirus]
MSTRISSATKSQGFEIRTPPALAALAKKFAPVVIQTDDTPVPPSNADYFSRMMLPTNIELDSGNYANIDVQFDFRYINNYILYHITALYPEMNIKGHPYVTPLSLAGYCLTIVYAHILACDATFRPDKSYPAARFLSDSDRKDLYDALLRCYVPTFLADLLLELSPVYDPRRTNLLWSPSLAGYLHLHDFGRTFPPQLYYNAHNLLASTRTNKDPDDVIDAFMALPILNYGNREFTTSNYLGTWFNNQHHPNFVNQDVFSFFNPLVGRALSARPTFARIPLDTEVLADDYTGNIYSVMLLASDENISISNTLITAISTFVHSDAPSSPQLGSILATTSGTLLLSCSIEPPTLPTWTGVPHTSDTSPTEITDKTFATEHNLFKDEQPQTGVLSWLDSTTGLYAGIYGLLKHKHTKADTPYKNITFTGKTQVIPSVLYAQPYDVSPSSLGLTIAAGIKIELAEISGFMVPTEHPESSLDDNNSQFLQSAIRAHHIFPILSSAALDQSGLSVLPRDDLDRTNQGFMFALMSMAKNVFPQLDNENIIDEFAHDPNQTGQKVEEHHYNAMSARNVKAGINGKLSVTKPHIWAWSSYRFVHKKKNPEPKDISFITSLRPIYGTSMTLSRSKHPSLLIPH